MRLKKNYDIDMKVFLYTLIAGGAGDFIDRGDNTYGGRYVINPSGGLISKGHPLGATGMLSTGSCYARVVEFAPNDSLNAAWNALFLPKISPHCKKTSAHPPQSSIVWEPSKDVLYLWFDRRQVTCLGPKCLIFQ